MTPEEKLKHLRDWMSLWIDERVRMIRQHDFFLWVYNETGYLLHMHISENPLPTFEKYLSRL